MLVKGATDIKSNVAIYVTHVRCCAMGKRKWRTHLYNMKFQSNYFSWDPKYVYSRFRLTKNALKLLSSLLDWCLWPFKRRWILFHLLVSGILAVTTRSLQADQHHLRLQGTHMKKSPFKNIAISAKKFWTQFYFFNDQEGLNEVAEKRPPQR